MEDETKKVISAAFENTVDFILGLILLHIMLFSILVIMIIVSYICICRVWHVIQHNKNECDDEVDLLIPHTQYNTNEYDDEVDY